MSKEKEPWPMKDIVYVPRSDDSWTPGWVISKYEATKVTESYVIVVFWDQAPQRWARKVMYETDIKFKQPDETSGVPYLAF